MVKSLNTIKGREDFREVQGVDHSIFVYHLGMAKDIFPDPETATDEHTKLLWKLRRECRGLVFDRQGKILSRRFHKFFNVNETEETLSSKINLQKPFVITEKLDGTMIAPFFSEGKLRYATKTGITDSTKLVEGFLSNCPINYTGFCTEWINKGYTAMFEYCGPKQPIVLTYQEEFLRLITLRNMMDGTYIRYHQLVDITTEAGIPLVKSWTLAELGLTDLANFNTFEQEIKNQKDLEGFVIRFDDGNMLKIKTYWYFSVNKALDRIKNCGERYLWNSILSEEYDDIKTFLNTETRISMDKFAEELNERIKETTYRLIETTKQVKDLERKDFSAWVRKRPSEERKFLWIVREEVLKDNENLVPQVRELLVKHVIGNLGSTKNWSSNVVPLLGHLKYKGNKIKQLNLDEH